MHDMEIIYLGHSTFRIKGKEVAIVADPSKGVSVSADIVTVSRDHPDHNNYSSVSGSPFIIQKPGEYEIKGASVLGFKTSGENTCFLYELDGLRIFHLGSITEKFIDNQMGEVGEIDVLLIAESDKTSDLISQIEPKIVVLMGDEIKQKAEILPKLTISKLDLPTELKIYILERKSG